MLLHVRLFDVLSSAGANLGYISKVVLSYMFFLCAQELLRICCSKWHAWYLFNLVPYLQPFHSVKFLLENGDLGSIANAAVRFGKLCFKVEHSYLKLIFFSASLTNAIDSFLLCYHCAIIYETGILTCISFFQCNFHLIWSCVVIISVDYILYFYNKSYTYFTTFSEGF